MTHAIRLASLAAIVSLALTACSNPTPRGYAYSGVPATGDRAALNSTYYTGGDPAFPRGGKGGGGP